MYMDTKVLQWLMQIALHYNKKNEMLYNANIVINNLTQMNNKECIKVSYYINTLYNEAYQAYDNYMHQDKTILNGDFSYLMDLFAAVVIIHNKKRKYGNKMLDNTVDIT